MPSPRRSRAHGHPPPLPPWLTSVLGVGFPGSCSPCVGKPHRFSLSKPKDVVRRSSSGPLVCWGWKDVSRWRPREPRSSAAHQSGGALLTLSPPGDSAGPPSSPSARPRCWQWAGFWLSRSLRRVRETPSGAGRRIGWPSSAWEVRLRSVPHTGSSWSRRNSRAQPGFPDGSACPRNTRCSDLSSSAANLVHRRACVRQACVRRAAVFL